MDWQQLVALTIVGMTAALLFWSRFRPRNFSFVRDTHCSCAVPGEVPQYTVVSRARKGERTRVTLNMK